MKLLFDDRYQHINRYGDPDLSLHCVLGCTIKGLDPQMLFDPFEEQFHLPAAFVKPGNDQGWQGEVVGQKDQTLVVFDFEEADASQFVGVILAGVEAFQGYGLVEQQPGGLVHRCRV